METNPLVSIIIPVYNVKPYFKRCLDSVVGQTYRNIEILLVDDGSIDGSGEICDVYARMDSRIVGHHQTNAGVSSARNWALDRVHGDYITFIDADDWIDKNLVTYAIQTAREQEADIVMYSYVRIKTGHELDNMETQLPRVDETMTTNMLVTNIITNTWPNYSWQAVYKASLWKSQRFPVNYAWLEDLRILPHVYIQAKKIVRLQNSLYYYNQMNTGSLTVEHSSTYWQVKERYSIFNIQYYHLLLAKQYGYTDAVRQLTIKNIRLGIKLYWRNYHAKEPLSVEVCEEIKQFIAAYTTDDIKKALKAKAKLFIWSILYHPILCKMYSDIRYRLKK